MMQLAQGYNKTIVDFVIKVFHTTILLSPIASQLFSKNLPGYEKSTTGMLDNKSQLWEVLEKSRHTDK